MSSIPKEAFRTGGSKHSPGAEIALVRAPERTSSRRRARFLAFLVLAATVVAVSRGVFAAYYGITDAFVTPAILTPDNEAVIESRLSMNRLLSERDSVADQVESLKSEIAVDDEAIQKLGALLESIAPIAVRDVTSSERSEVEAMVQGSRDYLRFLKRNLQSGLVHKSEVEHEQTVMHQFQAALFQNGRDQFSVREQVTRLEIDLSEREVKRRSEAAQLQANQDSLDRADKLLAQMNERPIFRAIERNQNVAFVPYKEIETVHTGGTVYRCRLWGFLNCDAVGHVSEVLPGEVITQDPWGATARGQYAILDLTQPLAAQSKFLRVRDTSSAPVLTSQR